MRWNDGMKKLARYLRHFKKEVILGPFFKLLEAIFELIVPLVMAKIIDVGVKNAVSYTHLDVYKRQVGYRYI